MYICGATQKMLETFVFYQLFRSKEKKQVRFVYLNNRFKNTFVTAAMFSSNIVKNGVLYLLI
jgi:hypothetical protein